MRKGNKYRGRIYYIVGEEIVFVFLQSQLLYTINLIISMFGGFATHNLGKEKEMDI